jgi:hypothetical protein
MYAKHTNIYRESKSYRGLLEPSVSTVDIFNTLRYFRALFAETKGPKDKTETQTPLPPDCVLLRNEMTRITSDVIATHPFACVSFRSLFDPKVGISENGD